MTYIFLAAGKGTRLKPLTLHYPKSLYRLDADTTVLDRAIRMIRKYDPDAEIVIVTGFMSDLVASRADRDTVVLKNPFYAVTNSIASLWFAREYLLRDDIVVINGDIVLDEALTRDVICRPASRPFVLLDSSIRNQGDYNVQVSGGQVLVMSKEPGSYYGEYAGVSKLDRASALLLKKEIEFMLDQEMYDRWYEDALVQMVFREDFALGYLDISSYQWTEVDCVDDLLLARKIHCQSSV